ncbi:MAG: hypothetical protein NTW54_04975 [Bacteroidetes bacterium]|nr:hypothetical protein [Bacteroidota bacterium]
MIIQIGFELNVSIDSAVLKHVQEDVATHDSTLKSNKSIPKNGIKILD